MKSKIKWNNKVKLIIADVDETIADLYLEAEPAMIEQLERILEEGKVIFLVTGTGLARVKERITDLIRKDLRTKILIAPCSAAEVWGFDSKGDMYERPYYSMYEKTMNAQQKKDWRCVIQRLVREFSLEVLPVTPIRQFQQKAKGNPLAVMIDDRDSQITIEVINCNGISIIP